MAAAIGALCTGLPASTSAHPGSALLVGVPLLRQQHSLTCEASATSMATRAQVSERQIMGTLPRNPNPNLGFRGNPDGQQGKRLVDYGVYAQPLHRVMAQYGYRSEVIMYGTDDAIRSYVDRGWPVVVWVTYQLQRAAPRLGIANGEPFLLVPYEHALTVVGYQSGAVIAHDPWTAKRVAYDWRNFNRAWGYFGDMALAVEPCPPPSPVTNGTVTALSAESVTWSWDRPANAARFNLTVILHGKVDRVVYQGQQPATQFTLSAPGAGKRYEIDITSVSPCGTTSDPYKLWTLIPKMAPSPTPTPTPGEGTVRGTVTPGPTVTATPSATPPNPKATPTPGPK